MDGADERPVDVERQTEAVVLQRYTEWFFAWGPGATGDYGPLYRRYWDEVMVAFLERPEAVRKATG